MMNHRLCFLCLIVLLAHTVAAQASGPSPAFEISGKVVDAVTGGPVPDAAVGISAEGKHFRTLITGKDGRFSFDRVTRGKYILVADAEGYFQQAFEAHGPYSTAIAAGPRLNSRNMVFRMLSYGSISGRITDDQNEPVRWDPAAACVSRKTAIPVLPLLRCQFPTGLEWSLRPPHYSAVQGSQSKRCATDAGSNSSARIWLSFVGLAVRRQGPSSLIRLP